jgi:hypothetical protein
MIIDELFEAPQQCPECGGISFSNLILAEKKDACYYKVKASAKVWPSAYASGRLVQCRKKGAANYGNKSEGVEEDISRRGFLKGAGAAAMAGAAGYQFGKPDLDNSFYKNPKAVFLIGYLHAAKEYMPRDKDTLEINAIIKDYLDYSQGKAGGLSSGSDQFFNDVGAYNRQHKLGKPGYTEVFDDDVDQQKWIQSQGKEALSQLRSLMQQTKESVQQNITEEQELDEKWSQKYKSSINCANPKGFSQKAHCAGKRNKKRTSSLFSIKCPVL